MSDEKKKFDVLVAAKNVLGREFVPGGILATGYHVDESGHLNFYDGDNQVAVFHRNYWLAVQESE